MPSSHSNAPAPSRDQLEHIVALLRADAVDAAIQAGLMDGWADACADVLEPDARSLLLAARVRLRTAWDARAPGLPLKSPDEALILAESLEPEMASRVVLLAQTAFDRAFDGVVVVAAVLMAVVALLLRWRVRNV